jgi:hypothetical protein
MTCVRNAVDPALPGHWRCPLQGGWRSERRERSLGVHLFNDFGDEEEPALDRRGALLVGFTLVGFGGGVCA